MTTSEAPVIVADASVRVSNLLPEDVNHAPSEAWFTQLPDHEELLEPRLLIVEIAATLSRRTNDPDVARRNTTAIEANPKIVLVSYDG